MSDYRGAYGVATAAIVDVVTSTNTTWEDAFQFDPPAVPGQPLPPYYPAGGTGPTWGFTGQNFRMDIKTNINASGPSLTLTSAAGQIVVDDYTNRILHMNVPETIFSGLIPGTFLYDFIMFDGSVPPIRVMLMQGKFHLAPGITGG
jgi:hypothetical protein